MRRNLWISAVLLAVVGTHAVRGDDAPPPVALAADSIAPDSVSPGSFPTGSLPTGPLAPVPSTDTYRAILLAPDSKPGPRDEAARRLAAAVSPADVAAIRDALLLGSVTAAQSAAARAISMTDTRDPMWVSPLAGLMGVNRSVSDPAIAALAVYAGTPAGDRALDALQQFATGTAPATARAPALRALGKFASKPAADLLVAAVSNGNPTLQSAAVDALVDLTGEPDRSAAPAHWQAWRAVHQGDSPLAFKAYLADVRTAAAGPARARQDQLNAEGQAFLETAYVVSAPASRARMLATYLDARSAPIRSLGAKLAVGEVGNRQVLGPALPRLRDLIADEDPDVRLRAVKAVQAAVDPQAGPILVAQLMRERAPDVQKQLFQAVGKLQILDAAPALISILADGRPDVAAAAARTLGEGETENGGLGRPLRAQRPAVADRACAEIHKVLAARAGPAQDGLRAEGAKALAALGDPQAFGVYRTLLDAQPPESWPVQVAALTGMGILADTRADQIVARWLGDRDNRVRLAAAKALRSVGKLAELQQLFNETNPDQERDGSVRDAAWQAMAHLLENGNVDLLGRWVTQFPNNPEHRLFVQQEYGKALLKAGQTSEVAANNQGIADTLTELKRYDEAVAPLQAAFDYYQSDPQAGAGGKLDNLISQLLTAQLKARQWQAAGDFAGRQIRALQSYQPTVGQAFERAAESLKADRDMDGLNALIAAAESIRNPPLENRFLVFLRDIRREAASSSPRR